MSVAHVFNGFKDLILQYDGKNYRFPYNETTKVTDQRFTAPDERKRNHESAPDSEAILEKTVEGIAFVTDLMNRHYLGLHNEGVVWIGDRMPTEPEKAKTMEKGRIKKMKLVEQALADRRAAIAKGGQPALDDDIVGWMQEYDIKDPLYNPTADGGFTNEQLEHIGAIAGAVVAKLTQPQPQQAKR